MKKIPFKTENGNVILEMRRSEYLDKNNSPYICLIITQGDDVDYFEGENYGDVTVNIPGEHVPGQVFINQDFENFADEKVKRTVMSCLFGNNAEAIRVVPSGFCEFKAYKLLDDALSDIPHL